ncbi:MAG: MBOAT family protein [Deltaproteobacteria bacterium]|nr:MAG: MBOAT family protein [Deltaproteobacteria bacterium]
MPFSSLLFLHLFLPAFLVAYWLTPGGARNYTAIVASLAFYAWGAPRFLPVVVALGVIDFAVSHRIARHRGTVHGKWLLGIGVTLHLSVLAYFKYSNFFVAQIGELLDHVGYEPLPWTKVVLPIGVSFITFEEISYLTDVYRGDARPARRLSHYLLFLTLFPHSIAGPIFRWKDLEAQLAERAHSWALAQEGFERFSLGLAKKLLVADSVAVIADGVFAMSRDQLTPALAWLGAGAYAIQIYFDFSGYSDMAIGLGKLMGFRFKENFDRPYISASITEFWTRWHISLSSWLRDYLYISIGGNRRGRTRTLVHVMIVFTLSGLWHGAAWTFVIWGVFHGAFVTIERLVGARRDRVPLVVQHATTLAIVIVGWVFFRAGSLGQALDVIAAMFGASGGGAAPARGELAPNFAVFALAVGAAIVLVPLAGKYRGSAAPTAVRALTLIGARLGYVALFVLSSIHLTNMRITPLIYFKF